MYKIWCYIVYGYIPKWDIIYKSEIVDKNEISIGRIYTLQCEQTGSLKFKKVWG